MSDQFKKLTRYCDWLKRKMVYHERVGIYYWKFLCDPDYPEGPSDCGICTNGARIIAAQFGGYVAGYPIPRGDSDDLVASKCGGHDFAVIGEYIVDWWGWEYEGERPVVPIEYGISSGKYKAIDQWKINERNDYRTDRNRINIVAPIMQALALIVLIMFPSISQAESTQTKASFYGHECAGLPMANTKPFRPERMTCASWFYPLSTRLLVTHGPKKVVVTVTDRGPARRLVADGRGLDLSEAAFRKLYRGRDGLIDVKIKVLTSRRLKHNTRSPK